MMIKYFLAASLCLVVVALTGCDQERLKQCEWYLVPEPNDMDKADPGMVALCARNFTTNKQRCRLQAKLELAEASFDKKVRFSDIEIDVSGKFPRTITSVKYCQ
jgi:hypothetical protein